MIREKRSEEKKRWKLEYIRKTAVPIVLALIALFGAPTAFTIVFNVYTESSEPNGDNDDISNLSNTECIDGEFDLTIIKCELDFEVTRPNVNWLFEKEVELHDIEIGLGPQTNPYYLGGITVKKPTEGSVSIRVYDGDILLNTSLKEMLDEGIETLNKIFDNVKYDDYITADKDTMWVFIFIENNSETFTDKLTAEKHNDKLYLFNYSFRNEGPNVEKVKNEVEQIINSIRYYP